MGLSARLHEIRKALTTKKKLGRGGYVDRLQPLCQKLEVAELVERLLKRYGHERF